MALPLLLGLAGSALAPTLGMGALTAGAIGSGLGSYLETGDLGQGIQTGLLSFLGGKALGSMFGGAAGEAAGAASGQAGSAAQSLPGGLQDSVTQSLMQPATSAQAFTAPVSASQAATTALPTSQMPSVFNPAPTVGPYAVGPRIASADPSKIIAPKQGFLEGLASDPTKGMSFMESLPYTGGAGLTTALMQPPPKMDLKKTTYNTAEAEAADRERFTPGAQFRPGIDPEFSYFGPTSFAGGGLAALKYEEGGEVPNDKELISDAVEAIQGRDENPEQTLALFVQRYGEDALRDLVDRVQSGEFDMNSDVTEGALNGAGDGMDDMIPATLEGEQDVVLSDGEFIVPADVVSGLGNGSTNAGSKALYEMMDRVREMRTGKKEQPDQVPQDMMLPA